MEIILKKDPFEYRRFRHILIFDNTKLSNNDAEISGSKICAQLNKITKMGWSVETCVGNKCTIGTKMVFDKKKRVKWRDEKIILDDVSYIR